MLYLVMHDRLFALKLHIPLIQGPGPSAFGVVCGSKLPLLYELVKLFYELADELMLICLLA